MNNKTWAFKKKGAALDIFSKYIKNNNKIIPFKAITSDVGKTTYFPPVSKEWKNSIYVFNQNNIKNLPIYDININLLIKNFFNLYFNSKFILKKYKSYRLRSYSFNKIYASKAEIKHTNNKAILTVYVYNREKISLYKKIRLLRKSFYNKIKLLICDNNKIFGFNGENSNNMYNKSIKVLLYKNLKLLRKYKLRLNLNKYKFEEKLLYKLKNFIVKFYNKKVEFNIVNLKSVVFHSDFFTKILTSKIRKRKANILKTMDTILNKVVLPKVNRIIEKSYLIRTKDLNLLENKYKYMNISFILKSKNLSDLFNKLYNNIIIDYYNINNNNNNKLLKKDYTKIYEIIFNSINYKNMAGLRLEVRGRLTKRYRADRSLFKVKWKGGLKNIDASYKGLSSVNYRGYQNPNVDYSIFTSKRRIGAFAVKGWISGKSYSTSATCSSINTNINPWAITGFSDAESSFNITVYEDNTRSIGWVTKLRFKIGLHNRDLLLLNNIKNFFSGGIVTTVAGALCCGWLRSTQQQQQQKIVKLDLNL